MLLAWWTRAKTSTKMATLKSPSHQISTTKRTGTVHLQPPACQNPQVTWEENPGETGPTKLIKHVFRSPKQNITCINVSETWDIYHVFYCKYLRWCFFLQIFTVEKHATRVSADSSNRGIQCSAETNGLVPRPLSQTAFVEVVTASGPPMQLVLVMGYVCMYIYI